MKELDAFSGKDINTACTIIQLMKLHNITVDKLIEYSTTKARVSSANQYQDSSKEVSSIFLKSGDIEYTDLKCVCGGGLLLEALCNKQAIKERCVRVLVCDTCLTETKIR